MTIKSRIRTIVIGFSIIAAGLLFGLPIPGDIVVKEAEARIGRPLTPLSYAGVARRTTRRAIRRSTIYMASLPRGCATTVTVNGSLLYYCGGTYYQPYNNQYVVVYVD